MGLVIFNMSFDDLMHDTISIYKENDIDVIAEKIKASVQNNKIFIMDGTLLVKDGYIIHRFKSNGDIDKYKVLDNGFSEGLPPEISPHYETKVIKLNDFIEKTMTTNQISITSNNSNIIVGNNNVLSSNFSDELLKLINNLEIEINKQSFNTNEVKEILYEFKQNNNKTILKSLFSSLKNLLPDVESITNILSNIANLLLK